MIPRTSGKCCSHSDSVHFNECRCTTALRSASRGRSEGAHPLNPLKYVCSGQYTREELVSSDVDEELVSSDVDSRKFCSAFNCNTYLEFCQTYSESTQRGFDWRASGDSGC